MEESNHATDNSSIPLFLKQSKLKLEGKCNKQISLKNNDIVINTNNRQNPKETIQLLFPSLSSEEISNILERAENNIEKVMNLIKELKEQNIKKIM